MGVRMGEYENPLSVISFNHNLQISPCSIQKPGHTGRLAKPPALSYPFLAPGPVDELTKAEIVKDNIGGQGHCKGRPAEFESVEWVNSPMYHSGY